MVRLKDIQELQNTLDSVKGELNSGNEQFAFEHLIQLQEQVNALVKEFVAGIDD